VLTKEGQRLIDGALEAHVDNLHRLADVLKSDEQAQLAALLRKLLAAEEYKNQTL
jgi:DNA-binding MarR family transcriptional regulator